MLYFYFISNSSSSSKTLKQVLKVTRRQIGWLCRSSSRSGLKAIFNNNWYHYEQKPLGQTGNITIYLGDLYLLYRNCPGWWFHSLSPDKVSCYYKKKRIAITNKSWLFFPLLFHHHYYYYYWHFLIIWNKRHWHDYTIYYILRSIVFLVIVSFSFFFVRR